MSLSPRNFFSCSRLLLSWTRVSAEEFESRSEIPKGSRGATRSFNPGYVGDETVPHVVPGISRMHERRVSKKAEALSEIHSVPLPPGIHFVAAVVDVLSSEIGCKVFSDVIHYRVLKL